MKPFWHRLALKKQREFVNFRDGDRTKLVGLPADYTIAEFSGMFRQPRWCMYPGALDGLLGCWSLFFTDRKRVSSMKDCLKCELCIASKAAKKMKNKLNT